ncbi:MAG: DNA polymerase III subunit chi [Gammaproteobacteria bacterium]|nr:DNA polymerase III subunit chi [Gammaproteobacteria bacterium]
MTRIDFYVLTNSDLTAKFRFACRLINKAYRQGHRIFVYVDDEANAKHLDELLWTLGDDSFVPHTLDSTQPTSPDPAQPSRQDQTRVLIGYQEPHTDQDDVMVSLSSNIPPFFSRFERLAELVGTTAQDIASSRERFRHYRECGYPLQTHKLGT